MKKYSVLFTIALSFFSLVLYQNCSDAQAMKDGFQSLSKNEGLDVDGDGVTDPNESVYEYNVNATDDVTLAAPEEDFKDFMTDGICEWSFFDANEDKTVLNNPESALFIPRIQKNQSGTYKLYCETRVRFHTFSFVVIVYDSDAPTATLATYKQYFVVGGKPTLNNETKNASENKALQMCVAAINANPSKWVTCTWNEATLLETSNPSGTLGNYKLYLISGGVEKLSADVKNIPQNNALVSCKGSERANTTKGIKCTWNGAVIHTKAEPPPPGAYKIYTLVGSTSTLVESSNIPQAEALTKCQATAALAAHAAKGIKCTWNESVIYQRAEPTSSGILYFGQGGNFREVGRKEGLTRPQAMSECTTNAAKYPQYSVKCYWGSELIWTR